MTNDVVRDGNLCVIYKDDRVAFVSEGKAHVGVVVGFTNQRVKVCRYYLIGSKIVYLKPKNVLRVCPYSKVTM